MAKKVVKKANKAAKKVVAKKAVKKAAVKKVVAKKVVKKAKPVAKAKAKPAAKPKTVKKVEAKKKPVPKIVKVAAKPVAKKVTAPTPAKAAPVKATKEDAKNRYSEKELVEFRKIILDKLDQAKKDYDLLKNTLCHTDDHGTDDTSPTFKMLEDGSDVLTREETAQLALRQEKFIQNLQNALIRIENKTYGICRATGKLIPKERLRRVPHATLSIDAKLEQQFNG
jgi:DnaK suppressor protein